MAKKKFASKNTILRFVDTIYGDCRDDLGEVILTDVEEEVMNKFDIEDEEFEDRDISFMIFTYLNELGEA